MVNAPGPATGALLVLLAPAGFLLGLISPWGGPSPTGPPSDPCPPAERCFCGPWTVAAVAVAFTVVGAVAASFFWCFLVGARALIGRVGVEEAAQEVTPEKRVVRYGALTERSRTLAVEDW